MSKRSSDAGAEELTNLRELAGIFARGVLRLRQRRHRDGTVAPPAKTSPKSAARGLEVPATTVLSVSNGVNGPESLKPRSTKC